MFNVFLPPALNDRFAVRRLFRAALVVTILLACRRHACAQFDLGSLTGNVTDSSGATIPGVNIQLKNLQTGATRSGSSSSNGSYTFPSLPTGSYQIEFKAPGFRIVTSSVSVTLSGAASFNAQMPVGNNSQQVTVEGGGDAELHTDSHEVGQVVGEELLTELPANGRNILNLAVLGPGSQEGKRLQPNYVSGFRVVLFDAL